MSGMPRIAMKDNGRAAHAAGRLGDEAPERLLFAQATSRSETTSSIAAFSGK